MCDFQGNMVQAMVLIIQITDLMAAMDLMDRMLNPIAGPTEVLSFFLMFETYWNCGWELVWLL